MRRLSHHLMILLLSASLGWHWDLLQGVGWLTMLTTRVSTQGIRGALETTFDGQHPCAICHLVKDGKRQESPPGDAAVHPTLKLELILSDRAIALVSQPGAVRPHFAVPEKFSPRAEPPAVPPPRTT